MADVPGLKCPECGREVKREQRLFATRRRWRVAGIGVALVSLSLGFAAFPRYQERGPIAFVPTDVLLFLLPPDDEAHAWDEQLVQHRVHPIATELIYRIESGALRARHWNRLMRRSEVLAVRPRWVRSLDAVDVQVRFPYWAHVHVPPAPGRQTMRIIMFRFSVDGEFESAEGLFAGEYYPYAARVLQLPPGPLDADGLQVRGIMYVESGAPDRAPEVLWKGRLGPPIEVVDSVEQCIKPTRDPQIDEIVRSGLRPKLHLMSLVPGRKVAEVTVGFSAEPAARVDSVAIGLSIEILRDDVVLERLDGVLMDNEAEFWEFEQRSVIAGRSSELTRLLACQPDDSELLRWKIRLRADPAAAMRDVARPSYWEGEIEFPLVDVLGTAGGG